MLGATTQKDIFARAEYQVGNAMTVFTGVQHNVDSQQTDVLTGVRIAFDGGRTVAKPTTGKSYGNHRFEQVNTADSRYAVQNPLQLGRIVTTTTDKQTVTTDTKRETTETISTPLPDLEKIIPTYIDPTPGTWDTKASINVSQYLSDAGIQMDANWKLTDIQIGNLIDGG